MRPPDPPPAGVLSRKNALKHWVHPHRATLPPHRPDEAVNSWAAIDRSETLHYGGRTGGTAGENSVLTRERPFGAPSQIAFLGIILPIH